MEGCLNSAQEVDTLCYLHNPRFIDARANYPLNNTFCPLTWGPTDCCPSQWQQNNATCYSMFATPPTDLTRRCSQTKKDADGSRKTFSRHADACSSGSTDLFQMADSDYSGNLSLTEYLSAVNMTKRGRLTTPEQTREYVKRFLIFDHDGNGFISKQEAPAKY